MEPLFFGIITEPWQVYVAAAVALAGSGTGLALVVWLSDRGERRRVTQQASKSPARRRVG